MKIVGIICEYNPFHQGHKYMLDKLRAELNPDAVVCVMSGNFVQRGMPAMWDKYERAQFAIEKGIDLVIELPTWYAVNSAKEFAKGGIYVLRSLGVTDIAFGSECGDIKLLKEAAEFTENAEFKEKLQAFFDEGNSYPSAYAKASENPIFDGPNNILGVEYLRQLALQKSRIKAHTYKRFYGVSAEQIRSDIKNGKRLAFSYPLPDWTPVTDERLFAMVRTKLLTTPKEELANVLEMSEGLENRLLEAVVTAKNLDDLILKAKSKRFTYARISRILIQMVLGMNKNNAPKAPKTFKILAFNETGREVLRKIKARGQVKFGVNNFDEYASSIYSVICGRNIYDHSDKVINAKPID